MWHRRTITCGIPARAGATHPNAAYRCVIPLRPGTGSSELAADVQELLPPLRADGVAVEIAQLFERVGDGITGRGEDGGRVAVRAAHRLLDDLVDHAEAEHVLR